MTDIETLTDEVEVIEIASGNPPTLLFRIATTNGPWSRTFTKEVAVPDQPLFERLQREAKPGDMIEITITTDWDNLKAGSEMIGFTPATATA